MRAAISLWALLFTAAIPQALAEERVFPVRLVIPAKSGGVTFLHFLHAEREKFDCTRCHTGLWPQNAEAALAYLPAGHQPSEEQKAACARCHRDKGGAFAAQGNCARCHSKYAGFPRGPAPGVP